MLRSILITSLMATQALAQGPFAIDGWHFVGCATTNISAYFPHTHDFLEPFRPQDCQIRCLQLFGSDQVALGQNCNCNDPSSKAKLEHELVDADLCDSACLPGKPALGYCGGGDVDGTSQRYSLYELREDLDTSELKKRRDEKVTERDEISVRSHEEVRMNQERSIDDLFTRDDGVKGGAAELATGSIAFLAMTAGLAYCLM